MKKSYISTFVIAAAVLVLAAGCDKDNSYDGMKLVVEGFGSAQKVAVSGTASSWVSGETLRINGADKTIAVDGEGNAYISSVNAADTYRAIYPASLNSSAPLNADAVTVTLPASYQWAVDANGRQLIASPMAAFGTSSSRLYFRHITSAIDVKITNYYGFTVTVDNVTVSSDAYQLSGSKALSLNSTETLAVNAATTETAADKQVQVLFDDNELQILAGQTKTVQVPVLPVGAGNHFTVSITVHKVGDAAVTKTLTKTQTTGGAMPRNSLATAPDTVGALFSVAADKKVIISQGNLQYIGSAATPYWKFADTQYEIFGNNGQGANGSDIDRDLFGWGTSGWSGSGALAYEPYSVSKDDADYYHSGDIAGTRADWGVNNAILNGGNTAGSWRTPTASQFTYLLTERIVANRFVKASVASVNGIIVFPDNYEHPEDITELSNVNDATKDYAYTIISTAWAKMEANGAIFMPTTFYRASGTIMTTPGKGYYWSSSKGSNNSRAYMLYSTDGDLTPALDNPSSRISKGYYVRLVKDVE